MATSSSSIKREHNIKSDPQVKQRQKRFKVGRACYSCRVKKIKCDGKNPCMQCLARYRQCTFSIDGSMDNEDTLANESVLISTNQNISVSDEHNGESINNNNNNNNNKKDSSNINDKLDKPNPPHSTNNNLHDQNNNNQSLWKQNLDNTTKILTYLSKTRPGEGKEGRWHFNDQQLLESSIGLPIMAAPTVHLPPRKQQKKLIQLYYQHHYPLFPMIPQDYFMEQYEKNRPFVTPFLLLVMFAHGSQYDENNNDQQLHNNKSNHYMKLAQGLLESILNNNIPSISTVVGLCLMSLYEPKQGKDYRLRSAAYSSIAFRMCNNMGLGQLQQCTDDIQVELRLRVAWACYCLDKMQSIYLGDPWLLRLQDMTVNLPQQKWPHEQSEHIDYFVTFIKLMQLAERVLNSEHLFTAYQSTRIQHDDSQTHQLDQELIQWLQLLPSHLKWTGASLSNHHLHHHHHQHQPMSMMVSTPPELPQHAYVAHLHLLYYLIRQHILIPYASRSLNNNHHFHLHQHCVAVATQITILTSLLIDQPFAILSYFLFGSSIILATRTHLLNCGDQNEAYSHHARSMFQKCMQSLLTISKQQERLIPGIDSFVVQVEQALQLTDTQVHHPHSHHNMPITSTSSSHSTPSSMAINAFDIIHNHHNESTPSTPHSFINGSEQSAEELLSQAFNPLPTTTTTTSSSSSPSSSSTTTNDNLNPHPHSSFWTSQHQPQQQQQQQQQQNEAHHLDFMPMTNNIFTSRMVPSSVDTLLYKSRFIAEDKRYQELIGGGLLMSHAKLNDPLLTAWMLKYAKELAQNTTTSATSTTEDENNNINNNNNNNNNKSFNETTSSSSTPPTSTLPMNSSTSYIAIDHSHHHSLWSTPSNMTPSLTPSSSNLTIAPIISSSTTTGNSLDHHHHHHHHHANNKDNNEDNNKDSDLDNNITTQPPPPPPPIRSFGQYMNIGLGVYASAHQHHNDVIRQHIPDNNNNSRSVILNHQGQVVVTQSTTDNLL